MIALLLKEQYAKAVRVRHRARFGGLWQPEGLKARRSLVLTIRNQSKPRFPEGITLARLPSGVYRLT